MHKTERPLILLIQAGNCFATFLISFSGFPRLSRNAIEKVLENFRLLLVRKDFLFDPFRLLRKCHRGMQRSMRNVLQGS